MFNCISGILTVIKLSLSRTQLQIKEKKLNAFQSVILNAIVFLGSPFSKKGTKAPQAAGKIHTDFEKGSLWLK